MRTRATSPIPRTRAELGRPSAQVDSFAPTKVAFLRFIVLPRSFGQRLLTSFALVFALSRQAAALEPLRSSEPRVLTDSAINLIQVADSFDGQDVFDLNLSLTFEHTERFTPIRRESRRVGSYRATMERLVPEVSVGLFPDFALTVGLPVILAYDQKLTSDGRLSPEATEGLPGEQLFQVPFTSPTRSGIEALTIALDLGLLNQWRRPHEPNLTIGILGSFNVSEPMHACNPGVSSGQLRCAHPSDRNRNGKAEPLGPAYSSLAGEPEGSFTQGRTPGVSRGTTRLEAHAYFSRRMGYIEPYTGVRGAFEFAGSASDFRIVELDPSVNHQPPTRGTLLLGLGVIPWEAPERHQRLALDFRATATYVSRGRDYSELFDALGSSSADSLREPQFAGYTENQVDDPLNPSVADPDSTRVHFTGLTTVEQHGDYTLSTRFTWQAGNYVNFDLGAEWRIIQAHLITADEACSPAPSLGVAAAGPCRYVSGFDGDEPVWQASGKPNPNYRGTINDPGNRYRADTSHGLRAWISARVMF